MGNAEIERQDKQDLTETVQEKLTRQKSGGKATAKSQVKSVNRVSAGTVSTEKRDSAVVAGSAEEKDNSVVTAVSSEAQVSGTTETVTTAKPTESSTPSPSKAPQVTSQEVVVTENYSLRFRGTVKLLQVDETAVWNCRRWRSD